MFANARPAAVVDYGPDPHNPAAQIVREAARRLHGFLVPVVAGGDTDPGGQWFGDTMPPQSFVGAAAPAHTAQVTRNGGNAELGSAASAGTMGDATRRTFAARLARQGVVL